LGAVNDAEALYLVPLMDERRGRTEAITATRIAARWRGWCRMRRRRRRIMLELSQDEAVKRNVAAILQAAERSRISSPNGLFPGRLCRREGEVRLFDIELRRKRVRRPNGEDAGQSG
jgi:hypothetical protein